MSDADADTDTMRNERTEKSKEDGSTHCWMAKQAGGWCIALADEGRSCSTACKSIRQGE